jgi:hypothetical protein
MRALLATPAALVMLAVAPAHIVPITSSEAASAITKQIHTQVTVRLRAGYRGETQCSAQGPVQQEVSPTTQLQRWRCTLELRGVRFPKPCKAEANVLATDQAHHVRIEWLTESKYCREPTQ